MDRLVRKHLRAPLKKGVKREYYEQESLSAINLAPCQRIIATSDDDQSIFLNALCHFPIYPSIHDGLQYIERP